MTFINFGYLVTLFYSRESPMGKDVELDEDPTMVTFMTMHGKGLWSHCHHCHDDDSDPEMPPLERESSTDTDVSDLPQDLIDHIGLRHYRLPCSDDHDDEDDHDYSDMPPLNPLDNFNHREYFNLREPKFCVEHGHNFGFHIVPLKGAPSVFIHGVFLVSHSYPP